MRETKRQEKRKQERWKASYYFYDKDKNYDRRYFEVFDAQTNEVMGILVDLTVSGMKISGSRQFYPGDNFNIKIALPEMVKDNQYIEGQATVVWCEQDTNPDFFNAGFKLSSITPPYTEIIEYLIGE